MPGAEFPTVFSTYITVYCTRTRNGFRQQSYEQVVDKRLWEPGLDNDYDREKIQVSLLYI